MTTVTPRNDRKQFPTPEKTPPGPGFTLGVCLGLLLLFGIPLACVAWAVYAVIQVSNANPHDAEMVPSVVLRIAIGIVVPILIGGGLAALFRAGAEKSGD